MLRHYNVNKENVLARVALGEDILSAFIAEMSAVAPWAVSHSGFYGDALEMAVSYYRTHRLKAGIRTGKGDMQSAVWGKVEIKSACGELPEGNFDTVLYCPEVNPSQPLTEQVFVFTREEWEDFLGGYNGRGQFIKVDSQRGKAHIQSFRSEGRPKASKPIRDYIDAVCAGQPTLGDF